MQFCSQCGIKMEDDARFCASCGKAVSIVSAPAPQQTAASPDAQKVLARLPNAKKMKMMGLFDIYTVVFTSEQAVFAKLSNEILKDVVRKSQAQSKAEGKGMFARVGAQMKAYYNASSRYLEMTPGQILSEDKNNYALPHGAVSSLKVKRGMGAGDEDGPGDPYVEVEWESTAGKYKYRFDAEENDVVLILEQFYPGKIRR
jgi:hypothetical protein